MHRSAQTMLKWAQTLALLALCFSLGCRSISRFDETSYRNATDLKVDTLALLALANENAGDYEARIERLRLDLWKAHEYEKGRAKNQISARMWEVLRGDAAVEGRVLVGGFLELWQQQGTMSPAVIEEATLLIERAFDEIIALESGKTKPGDADLSLFGITE